MRNAASFGGGVVDQVRFIAQINLEYVKRIIGPEPKPGGEEPRNIKGIARIGIRQVLVVGVFGNIIFTAVNLRNSTK